MALWSLILSLCIIVHLYYTSSWLFSTLERLWFYVLLCAGACTEQQLSRPLQRLPPEDGDSYSKKGEDSVGDKNADLTLPTEDSDTTEAQEENDLKSELWQPLLGYFVIFIIKK